jgi:hypothetical protein
LKRRNGRPFAEAITGMCRVQGTDERGRIVSILSSAGGHAEGEGRGLDFGAYIQGDCVKYGGVSARRDVIMAVLWLLPPTEASRRSSI